MTGLSDGPGRARRWLALGRCHLLSWLTVLESLVGIAAVGAVLTLPVGIGFVLVTPAATALRRVSERARGWAGRWSGVTIDPPDPLPASGAPSRLLRSTAVLGAEGFWRDLAWAVVDPLVGGLLVAVPLCLVWYGAFGVLVQPFLWPVLGPDNWYAFIPVDGTVTMLAALVLGAAFVALGVLCAPPALRLHARWTRALLTAPRHAALTRRVAHLADTRSEALDAQAAELQRIERDLHDGPQARLVAMGMTLDRAARLLDSDLAEARRLLLDARAASGRARHELRDLVRGINPPVLADRGLGDAVRALALDSLLDVDVRADLPGRLPVPLESAVYFAVTELLANTAKHAGARTVRIVLEHSGSALRVTVTDDGHGGADFARGTGLRGLQRRLDRFDGILVIHSPPGGPTTATMEIPCVLSSPKTSSSSVTG
ncbi:sensor histidine kinase [Micromonospora fulviviridis]|uniref:histidine kinase n=1 Tax=Micromonospora fulviviridis TaxID=47860 RepID=A0ABV2VKD2_9ACTN